jgi:hypothetical protein
MRRAAYAWGAREAKLAAAALGACASRVQAAAWINGAIDERSEELRRAGASDKDIEVWDTKGHDLYKGDQLIEVKSRLIDRYQDNCQFNFRKYSAAAHVAFCLAWQIDKSGRPQLVQVFKLGVPFLVETWAKPNQPIYCARTTLGKLRQVWDSQVKSVSVA